MMHAPPQIGVAQTGRGILVSLPARFWLVVALRRRFRRVQAAAEPWTYLVPGDAGRQVEGWIAEVELRLRIEARRRAWSATDAEWDGVAAPAPHAPHAAAEAPIGPSIAAAFPKENTARPVLDLLQRMGAGGVLMVQGGHYTLLPSRRPVRASVAERAIRERLVLPNCDGLFCPDWSQSWRAPQQETVDATKERGRPQGAAGDRRRAGSAGAAVHRPAQGGPGQDARKGKSRAVVADGAGPARRRRRGVVT